MGQNEGIARGGTDSRPVHSRSTSSTRGVAGEILLVATGSPTAPLKHQLQTGWQAPEACSRPTIVLGEKDRTHARTGARTTTN